MRSTVALFKKMYEELPPLFPAETKRKMNHALSHLEKDSSLTVTEVEDTMIVFGYEAWPWIRAYREFLALSESKVGEHFLLPKLSESARLRYEEFKSYGGTLRDLHHGRTISFFSEDDRENFRFALVEIQAELRDYTNRSLIGLEQEKYLNRVEEFAKILESIRVGLEELKRIADLEQDHPALADEIRSKVRAFEYGLCLLGPQPNLEAIEKMPEHFTGRKSELSRMRGIHLPGEFVLED